MGKRDTGNEEEDREEIVPRTEDENEGFGNKRCFMMFSDWAGLFIVKKHGDGNEWTL